MTPEAVKEAQGITGALLWMVTRSRPDLAFVVSKMGQWMTKAPVRVRELGVQALKYLASTTSLALEYRYEVGPEFGEEDQIPVARSMGSLEIYADASHAPERSTQGVVVAWRSALIFWESTKQPFVTLSSAESELVAMVAALQIGDSIAPVIEELTGSDVNVALLGDNQAAIASFGPGSGWRNRHLRMRAAAARERIAAGILTVTHVPGDLQVADVATKPLATARVLSLLGIVNVRLPATEVPGTPSAKLFGRLNAVLLQGAENLSPATLMVLALLTAAPPVEAVEMGRTPKGCLWVAVTGLLVNGQPQGRLEEAQGLIGFVVCGLVLFVVAVCWGFWPVSFRVRRRNVVTQTLGIAPQGDQGLSVSAGTVLLVLSGCECC